MVITFLGFKSFRNMKTVLKSIIAIALAAYSFSSCQVEISPIIKNDVQFTLIGRMPETKTGIYYDEGSYIPYWNQGDELGVLFNLPTSAGDLHNDAVFSNTSEDGNQAAFSGTVSIPEGSGITFYSYYPASAGQKIYKDNDTEAITFGLDVPSTQHPALDATFGYSFDPDADILVARPATCNVVSTTGSNNVEMYFTRITSVLRLALNMENSGVTGYGEKVSKVTIQTSSGDIAGRVVVDLATGRYSKTNNKTNSKELTAIIDPTTVPITVGSGNKNVFFSVAPVTIPKGSSITFTIETVNPSTFADAHKIVKTVASTPKDIVFESSNPTVISLTILESEVGLADSLNEDDYSGDYFITNAGKTAAAVKYPGSGNNLHQAAINYNESMHALSFVSGDPADSKFTLAKITEGTYSGMYTIKDADNNYLYAAGSSNNYLKGKASASEDTDYWTVTCDNEGNWSVVATKTGNRNVMQYNANNSIFACYASASQTAVALVPWSELDAKTPVTLTFAETSISMTTSNCNEFTGQTASASPNESAITDNIEYSWGGDAIGTVNSSTGAVSLNGTTGSATVTASFAGDEDYSAAQTSYTINVTSGVIDYSTLQTSNVTLSTAGGTSASAATVNTYDALKAGTGSVAGAVKITVPANTTNLHIHAAAWNGETVVVGIAGATADPSSLTLLANSGISNSTPFTLSDTNSQSTAPEDYYFNVSLSGIDSDTELTFTATSGKRFVIWGVNAVADTREDAGMSWSAASATATYNTGNTLSFTPLTLTPGNATGITYQSTDETIATINSSGVITITALSGNDVKEGSTTIKAIFAGNATYKPQTVSYTLTVADSRTAATTPTFSPAAGEVEADQVVTFNPTDQGLTFHYTVDGSNPTVSSPTAASVTINAAKTVKVLATKTGYKPSAVATAAYTIQNATENLPFSESFSSTQGSFTVNDVTGSNTWSCDASNHYMKATSYYSSANHDAESWLISPWLQCPTLSAGESIKLRFSQCINKYFGTIGDEATVWVKSYGGDWTQKTITYPSLSGNWSAFEEQVIDLSSYGNQKIQIAFKYVGTTTASGTWEVKSVSVQKYSSYAVTFGTPANGTIVVKHGETTLTSGDTVAEGETVTITTTPSDGYALSSLVYNDGSDHDIKSAKSFTMPAHAVSITATFESGVQEPTLQYTLDGTTAGTGNNYAGSNTATQGGIVWKINGNLTMNPWRIGGNSLSNVNRVIYSTNPISANISEIRITHGTANSITVNSMTVSVHSSAADAQNGTNAIATFTPSFVASNTVTVNKADATSWAGKYYRIVYNVSVTGSTNRFIQFISAAFWGTN